MEVIRDGNHALHNLTEEQKRNLPGTIRGICPCGAGPFLSIKIGVFDKNTAWYVCSACGYQISMHWQHEEERFTVIRSILEALASGSNDLDHYREKAVRLLSHAQQTGVMHKPYFSREENEKTVREYVARILDVMSYFQGDIHTYLIVKHPNQYVQCIKQVEQLEEALAEIKLALQGLQSGVI